MRLPHHFMPLALLLVLLAASPLAHAVHISGSFTGVASAEQLPLNFPPPRPESYYNGALVSGTFELNTGTPRYQVGGDDYAYFLNTLGGSFSLKYTIREAQFDYVFGATDPDNGIHDNIFELGRPTPQSPQDSALFMSNFHPKYEGAWFTLAGPAGSLFDGLDANTMRFDPTVPYTFTTGFANASAEMRIGIDIRQVRFDATPPVPEPVTSALFLAGLGVLGWQRARARRAPFQEAA